jgi:hypothetical protein
MAEDVLDNSACHRPTKRLDQSIYQGIHDLSVVDGVCLPTDTDA